MGARDVIFTILAIDEASHTFDKIGRKAEETGGKFGVLGAAAGMGLATIGVAAAAATVEGVKLAASFQSSMAQLATQAHVPQKEVNALSQSVLNLAGKVGEGPDSLAEALYHIESSFASAGIKGSQAMHLLQTASEGAKLGHADLVDVTNALDAAVVSGIPGVKNFDQAMGMLNATVGAGDMHMQDLADAFGTGAVAVVKNYGLSLRDVGSALAVFGDNNIRGAEAGTALRMTVQSLAVPAKTGKHALEELGLTQSTLAKDMQSGGLIKAVRDLHERLDKAGLSGKKSGDVLTQAFGKKAGVGLAMLVDQFDRLKSKYVEVDKGAKTFGDSWKTQQATFQQGWDQFKASTEAALTQLGLKLLPMLTKALPMATAAATAAVNGLSTAISVIGTWLSQAHEWLEKTFGDKKTQAQVNELRGAVVGAFKAVLDAVVPVLQKIWTTIQTQLVPAFMAFAKAMEPVVVFMYQKLGPIVATVFKTILTVIDGALKIISGLLNVFAGIFTGNWSRVWLGVKQILSGVWEAILGVLKGAFSLLVKVVAAGAVALFAVAKRSVTMMLQAWDALPGLMLQVGKDIVMGIVHGVQAAAGAAVNAVKGVAAGIMNGIKGFLGISSPAKKMVPVGRSIIDGVTVGLKQAAPDAYAALRSFAMKIADIKVSPALKASISKVADHIGSQMVLTTNQISGLTSKIKAQKQAVADMFKKRDEYANTLAQSASGGGITGIGLLQLDDQGRNADAQTKLTDAQTTATDAAQKYADAQDKLNDLLAQQAARQSTLTDAVTAAQQQLSDLTAQEAARKTSTVAQLQAMRDAQQAVTDAQAAAAAQNNSSVAQLQALADAQKAVTDAQTANADGQAKLTTAQDTAKNANTNQATDYLDQLKARVRAIHSFSDDMNKLKAEGLSQDVLQQIAQAGLDTGGALAKALAEQGTPETIRSISAMSKQINDSSASFGKTWAAQMYNTGIDAANGILKGLESKQDDLLAMIRKMAQSVVDEIKRTLKIKSPSGVMADEVGAMIPAGIAAGMTANAHLVTTAARGLVPSTAGAYGASGGRVGSVGGGVTNIHLHVQSGFVGSPDQLATALSDVISRAKARGLNLSFA